MAAAVCLEAVRKVFRIPRRGRGLRSALRTLFSRQYDECLALDNLSFSVDQGQIVGYIGPNGAGKSTTIKLISGVLRGDGGCIRVQGRDPFRERREHVQGIGVVFGQRTQLYWDVSVRESFALLARIYGVSSSLRDQRIEEFDHLLGIGRLLDLSPRRLSLGQRMACDIAASLLHQPAILFLDEPTIGLDVQLKERIRCFIRQINEEHGTTVILTTHDLTDIERLAHRVLVIDQGRLVLDGSLDSLRRQMGNLHDLQVDLAQPLSTDCLHNLKEQLSPRLEDFQYAPAGLTIRIRFDPHVIPSPQLFQHLHQTMAIRNFSLTPLAIDELVRRYYQERSEADSQ